MTDATVDQSLASTNGQVKKISTASHEGNWVATLSNGTTAVEKQGKWTINTGERLPWVRLCYFAADNDLHLTSLRFNYKGRTIHLPRERFAKFSMEDRSRAPSHYSVQYHLEVDDVLSGSAADTMFVDLAAHYEDFAVHYIQDMTNGNDSWIVITDSNALAPSPKKTGD